MSILCEYKSCERIVTLPHKCKFCHKIYCSNHLLPEDHSCQELLGIKSTPPLYRYPLKPDESKSRQPNSVKIKKSEIPKRIEKFKFFLRSNYYKLKNLSLRRNHNKYSNWGSFFMNVLWLSLISLLFAIFYSNAEQLNSIKILFVPLGLILLIIFGVVWIKFLFKLLKKIKYWFIGERNIVRYIVLILLIILAWYGYENRDTIFNPLISSYESINFTEIIPIDSSISDNDYKTTNSNSNENINQIKQDVENIFKNEPERKEECKQGLDYVNIVRKSYGKTTLEWDDNLYDLAVYRAKDMYDRKYFDHTTPDGECTKDFKAQYGLSEYSIAENIGAQTWNSDYSIGNIAYVDTINVKEQIDIWLSSRGHRYNLLYDEHIKGAIGCYYGVCVFLGANINPYGFGAGECTTGEQGLAYWQTAEQAQGEV